MSPARTNKFLNQHKMKNCIHFLRQLFSEFLGSFLYLALVLSAGIRPTSSDNIKHTDAGSKTLVFAVANGLLVASVIVVFGHVSGGHINPAVTLGSLICKHIRPFKALCYVLMQVTGSIAGAGVAYLVSSEHIHEDLGAIIPYKHLRADQIFALEFLMTFLLVSVFLSVIDTTRGARGLGSSPLAIGICITGCISACATYTASLNPIRCLGPAVIMGIWTHHWVYWVAPLAAGLVAGLVYRFVLVCHRHTVILSTSHTDIHRSVMVDK